MASAIYHPNASQYEGLLNEGKPKTSDRLQHTARGLEAIGFNASASMYHVDRQDSIDDEHEKVPQEKKPKKSFLKKLVGGGKDKQQKI
ncbi:hypothetical protein P7C71_g275, partial [Lecanoromycetidae sp. Uapishka_2]